MGDKIRIRIKVVREDIYEFDKDDIPIDVSNRLRDGKLEPQQFENHPYVVDKWSTGCCQSIIDTHSAEIHMIGTEVIKK